MKTEALKQALNAGYSTTPRSAAPAATRRRAAPRSASSRFRDKFHQWDPKNQRPELWNLYNCRVNKGESIRVFPLSNWTELDVWLYVHYEENLPMVPLYFAKERPVVRRNGALIMVDDDRLPKEPANSRR